MAEVFIPAAMRSLTGGERIVIVPGETVGALIAELEQRFPGIQARLVEEEKLRPGLVVSVDGQELGGKLKTRVQAESKVYFVQAASGGQARARSFGHKF